MKIASLFTDNMVLQQGMPVPVWGTAQAGTEVTVSFAGQTETSHAGPDGSWRVNLKPLSASREPRVMTVESPGSGPVTFSNVLVGEVWISSGQSNMEFALCNARNAGEEIAAARFPDIRLLTVPRHAAKNPQTDIPGAAWKVCSPKGGVAEFSAVAYFFGRELHRRLGVPIGLINASWGGTPAEAWVSREGLLAEPAIHEIVEALDRALPKHEQLREGWEAETRRFEEFRRDVGNTGLAQGWAAPGDPSGEWKEMNLPGVWQNRGVNISGILWFRKTVDLPESWAGKDLELAIGATDKSDVTYFNGEKVGSVTMLEREDSWSHQRKYTVPGRLVKAGRNVIAVRVHSDKYQGGMTGPAESMHLRCPALPGEALLPLPGIWHYAIEADYGVPQNPPPMPLIPGNPNMPCTLYDGMIAPVAPFALRGAIWYQGESNVGRARQYGKLFPALIRAWGRTWGRAEFPFYFVQLANHLAVQPAPGESPWAELREAQTMALALPQTGMAVAIDIGEAEDIHPRNKQDAGLRLALNALHQTYGQKAMVPCGPIFKKATREGGTFRLSFHHTTGGLEARGKTLQGFAIAGPDRKFVWADARIDGEEIIVSAATVKEPVAVRYAWADNPVCNLYNKAGLPGAPFRSDEWPNSNIK